MNGFRRLWLNDRGLFHQNNWKNCNLIEHKSKLSRRVRPKRDFLISLYLTITNLYTFFGKLTSKNEVNKVKRPTYVLSVMFHTSIIKGSKNLFTFSVIQHKKENYESLLFGFNLYPFPLVTQEWTKQNYWHFSSRQPFSSQIFAASL